MDSVLGGALRSLASLLLSCLDYDRQHDGINGSFIEGSPSVGLCGGQSEWEVGQQGDRIPDARGYQGV